MQIGFMSNAPILHRYKIGGTKVEVYDQAHSQAADYVAGELILDSYGLGGLRFGPGERVLDIGGHIGLFAIYLALRHPGLRIYSYEPHPDNFKLFDRNLALNGVTNVRLYPEALSSDGRPIALACNPTNSGAVSAYSVTLKHARVSGVPSLTLDQMFDRDQIERCSLLKIDCEGSEYEALLATQSWPRVERLCGEFHSNRLLESRGHSPEELRKHCEDRLGPAGVNVSFCRMSE
jgi:FkbM family methyltransferase